jgi:hypothetical protein
MFTLHNLSVKPYDAEVPSETNSQAANAGPFGFRLCGRALRPKFEDDFSAFAETSASTNIECFLVAFRSNQGWLQRKKVEIGEG